MDRGVVVFEVDVSIHAPREGCDSDGGVSNNWSWGFNSRTPGGVRLLQLADSLRAEAVSIHAPREGCDRAG